MDPRSRATLKACKEENAKLELCFLTKGSLIWDNCKEEKEAFYKCRKEARDKFNQGMYESNEKNHDA